MSARQRKRRLERRQRAARTTSKGARIAAGAGITVGAVLGSTASAQAATFVVDRSDDTNVIGCDSGTPNDCTLRGALNDAAANGVADEITFAAAITGITLGGTQLPTINDDLYLNGPGAGTLTVSGGGPPSNSRILDVDTAPGDDVTVEGVTLSGGGSNAPTDVGGAIRSADADLTVKNSTISGNRCHCNGGGIGATSGTLTVEGSTLSYDFAYTGPSGGGSGGAIAGGALPTSGIPVTVRDSTLSDNVAYGGGGGLAAGVGSTVTIESSTLSGNEAPGGGGISASTGGFPPGGATLTIESSTISGNYAFEGGGIFAYETGLTILRSTIAANYAAKTGGIWSGPSPAPDPVLTSTIVADNNGARGKRDLQLASGSINVGFSLIEDPGGQPIGATGPNVIGADPQLGALANNGGPTQTMKPASTSPAIDQGFTEAATTDQRGAGFARVFDVPSIPNAAIGADIGAFELQAGEYVAPTPTPTPAAPASAAPSSTPSQETMKKKCKQKSKKARKKCKKKAKQQAS